jgi:hypothetical protein
MFKHVTVAPADSKGSKVSHEPLTVIQITITVKAVVVAVVSRQYRTGVIKAASGIRVQHKRLYTTAICIAAYWTSMPAAYQHVGLKPIQMLSAY